MIEQIYKLNLIPGGVPVRVPVSQYDAGSRDITFSLYSGGLAFTVPAGAVVTCDGAKPDRKGFSYLAAASGSTVTVSVTEQMTAVAGEAECQITIRKDGQVLGTANFLLAVERAALPDGVDMSETDIAAFTQIANAAAESAQEAQEAANTLDGKRAALDASTAAADAANINLTATTNAANTARTNLVTATNAGNTAHTNLVSATNAANTAKDALTQPTADAQAAKTALDAANETAADNLEALNNADAMAQKIPKVSPAVAGNLAALKADGTLLDSGKKPGDFAPGGYGLGGIVSKSVSSLDNTTETGWYDAPYPSEIGFEGNGLLLVQALDATWIIQEFYPLTDSRTYLRRQRFNSGWGPWEWSSPPMIAGVEYRTTERHLGKPVYVKLVDCGAMPNSGQKNVVISAASGAIARVIRATGVTSSGAVLPGASSSTNNRIYAEPTFISITTSSNMSSSTAHVTVWYTKT